MARESQSATQGHLIFVIPALKTGGMEKQLVAVLEADVAVLQRRRVELLTFLPAPDDRLLRRLERIGVLVHMIDRSAMSFPSFFIRLVRFFRAQRPDIVHALLAGSTGTWGRLAARLAGVRTIVFSDRTLFPPTTRIQRALDPLVIRLTTRFVTNAQATFDRLHRQGVPGHKIRLVRNGVDLERYHPTVVPSLRATWGITTDKVVAGFLGVFRPTKRPELFLEAILALPQDERPDFVVMAGDGVRMEAVRCRVESDPWLRSNCRLLGTVHDVPAFLRSLDFLVLTSDTEGLPNAILEAMASGVPSVSTRIADAPTLIDDDRFLAEPGDVAGLAAAIRRMMQIGREERKRLGDALRARAETEFALATSAQRFWAVHDDLWPGPASSSTRRT